MFHCKMMQCVAWSFFVFVLVQIALVSTLDSAGTLECHQRLYTYRVVQSDEQGRQCWDTLSVKSCWGRCDSNEISDWRFPYKRSYHPVCVHAGRIKSAVKLRHCEAGAAPGTDTYVYLEADGCRCQACSSSNTSCEGLHHRGQRTQALHRMAEEHAFGFNNVIQDN